MRKSKGKSKSGKKGGNGVLQNAKKAQDTSFSKKVAIAVGAAIGTVATKVAADFLSTVLHPVAVDLGTVAREIVRSALQMCCVPNASGKAGLRVGGGSARHLIRQGIRRGISANRPQLERLRRAGGDKALDFIRQAIVEHRFSPGWPKDRRHLYFFERRLNLYARMAWNEYGLTGDPPFFAFVNDRERLDLVNAAANAHNHLTCANEQSPLVYPAFG